MMNNKISESNLQRFCEALGWQGGTHTQVNEELQKLFNAEVDVVVMTDEVVEDFIDLLEELKGDK